MDLNIYEHHQPSNFQNSKINDDKKTEAGELLERNWFFGNLLDKSKTRKISRSFSDPCSSSNYKTESSPPGKSYEEAFESIEKLPAPSEERSRRNLIKAPTMPLYGEKKNRISTMKGNDFRRKKKTSSDLVRAPSLPSSLGSEGYVDEEEVEFSMGKLIRQASMNKSPSTLPPRTNANKISTPSSSLRRSQSIRKPEVTQGIKMECLEETRRPPTRLTNRLKPQKSCNDIESIMQGVKDLSFDKKDLKSNPISIKSEKREEKYTRRQYSSAPPVPKWGVKRTTGGNEDMKEQIKFWARAVASNVRQEC